MPGVWPLSEVCILHQCQVFFSFLFFPPAALVQLKMVKCIAKLFETVHSALSVHAHSCRKMNKQPHGRVTVGDIYSILSCYGQTEGQRGQNLLVEWFALKNWKESIIVGPVSHVLMNQFQIRFSSQSEWECESILLLRDIQHTSLVKTLDTLSNAIFP